MSEKIVKIGLAGFGTVGCGVVKIILEQSEMIAARTGIRLQLGCVVDIDTTTKRPVELPPGILTNDINKLISDKSISIGVELIGGTKIAKEFQIKMLQSGKDVVTANKALLAEHGSELYKIAKDNGRCIAFEASCAGGIPIINAIRTGLNANRIDALYGIVNGTCNYILSNMTSKHEEFADALKQAQQKGFAEADPTLDISGGDSAHKLAVLASIAFGYEFKLEDIYTEGIQSVSKDDIFYGGEMGYVLKLLAIGERHSNGKISLRVHPSFISAETPLARVSGPFNAINIFGNAVGQLMFYGRGAGMMPTASAVVADIIDAAIGNSLNTFNMLQIKTKNSNDIVEKIGQTESRFYIRLMVSDQPGVFAQIAKILAENQISISGILQHEGRGPDNTIPIVITTHPTPNSRVKTAIEDLNNLNMVCGKAVCIRIVDIPEDK